MTREEQCQINSWLSIIYTTLEEISDDDALFEAVDALSDFVNQDEKIY